MLSKTVQKYCVDTLCIFAVFLFTTNVFAHGGVTIENDKCLFRSAGYLIHFTAYQPTFSKAEELCRSINSISDTILVLDFVEEGLRKTPVKIILEKQNSEKKFIYYLEKDERKYPSGTTQLNLKNVEAGTYRLHVNLQNKPHEHLAAHLKPGYFQFTIKEKLSEEDKSLFKKYNWLFYLASFGLLVYFLSVRFRK